MPGYPATVLRLAGVDPRGFIALTRAMILMDLRGQHYAAATASKPKYVLSPLVIVVGQWLATSLLTCALLFARVDVFFFAFANLAVGMVLMAAAVVVEFQEVVSDPADLAVLGPRPIAPRTYAAARFANLLFYFGLMYLSLHLVPAIVGAGLRDAGPWYAAAYVAVSLCGSLTLTAALVLASVGGRALRQVLSWAQIASILVVFYGGQLVLRDGTAALQVWAAFPPAWVDYLPPAWLARVVERAAVAPDATLWPRFLGAAGVAALACAAAVARLSRVYASVRPVEVAVPRARPMAPSRLGGLRGWAGRGPEERVGYWLGVTFLRRDPGLTVRCLATFVPAVVVLAAGLTVGPYPDPGRGPDPAAALPVLAFFLVPAAAPALVHNLGYARAGGGGWALRAAPVAAPLGLGLGAAKAVFVWTVLPLCGAAGAASAVAWGAPLSAALHAALAAGLTWVMLVASFGFVARAWPFSLPPARGAGLAPPPLPTAGLNLALAAGAGAHALLAAYPAYWVAVFAGLPVLARAARGRAAANLARIGGPAG